MYLHIVEGNHYIGVFPTLAKNASPFRCPTLISLRKYWSFEMIIMINSISECWSNIGLSESTQQLMWWLFNDIEIIGSYDIDHYLWGHHNTTQEPQTLESISNAIIFPKDILFFLYYYMMQQRHDCHVKDEKVVPHFECLSSKLGLGFKPSSF